MLIDRKNRYVIGFDLGMEYAQVSYCRTDQSMPETFSTVNGQEQFNIPTMLCEKNGEWFAGDVALQTFLKKTLNLLGTLLRIEDIAAIAFNLEDANVSLMNAIKDAMSNLKLKNCEVYFMTYNDSFFQYLIHQPEEMWLHDVILFDYRNEGITGYRLSVNRKTKPQVCCIDATYFGEMKYPDKLHANKDIDAPLFRQLDECFLEIAQKQCEGLIISSVFLLGDNFTTDWCKQSLKFLCRGRRVFQGNNLFSKGACYGAREKVMPSTLTSDYVFLSEDKLKANIGLYCMKGSEEVYIPLLNAGDHWYEARNEMDFILDKENKVMISLIPLNGGQPKKVEMTLDGLHVRGNKTNRIGFRIEMKDQRTVELTIVDKGFGEFYAATGQVWRESFEL